MPEVGLVPEAEQLQLAVVVVSVLTLDYQVQQIVAVAVLVDTLQVQPVQADPV
jgi:hypothetical protein